MSSGSSGSASICSRVSRFPNELPARVERAVPRVLTDDDVLGDLREAELHLAPRAAAGTQAEVVQLPWLEARELRANRVPSGRERGEDRLAAFVGHDLDSRSRGLGRLNRDPGVDDDGARLIGDRDAQRRVARGLREHGPGPGERQRGNREQAPGERGRRDH